jgi:hypothetical protein
MEIKTETIEVMKQLSDEQKSNFATKLAGKFAKWDEDRADQITTAKEIMEEVYLNQPARYKNKKQAWKSDVKLNGLHNIKKAMKSMLWREVYPSADAMFNVRGTNEQTEKTAKQQKASVVDSLNKMNIAKQCDIAVDSLLDIGEMIAKVDWVSKKKIVKRQDKNIGWVLQSLVRSMSGAGFETVPMKDVEIPVYENARVETISPFMFVFDHSKFKLYDEESWDSLTKIYKRFDTLDNIKANKVYTIKPEWLEQLKVEKDNKSADNEETVDLRDKTKYGDMYSVLLAHGDFKINGKIYKNYIAEVLAGKYLIRFEENPMFINPFVFCALEYDPTTKRGIPLLKSVMQMCKEEERLTNLAFDVQSLTVNPVQLAPKGVFEEVMDKDGLLYYEPGKVIEYEENLSSALPTPIQINANGISDLIGLLNQKIADLSSVSNVMFGNIESEKRTATELSLADKGSTAQTGKILDIFNQDFILPIIKRVAELIAMFESKDKFVYSQEKGINVEYKITNEIRQAQYEYIYEDRNALNDYKTKVEMLYKVCQGAFQLPELAQQLDAKEIFTKVVETLGFDNVDTLFKQASPATQFAEQLRQIPQNMQEQVVGQLQGQLQQMAQQYQMQQQQAEMQAQAQKQVQMQLLRDNARAEMEAQQLQQMGVM